MEPLQVIDNQKAIKFDEWLACGVNNHGVFEV